jgi:hypothetical protein
MRKKHGKAPENALTGILVRPGGFYRRPRRKVVFIFMAKMTFEELHDGEIFTDNTQIEKNKQCKDCMLRSDGTADTNDYRKCECVIYQYPESKPSYVFNNTGKCEYYEKAE